MYFNDEKNSTNIDEEFNEKKNFKINFNSLFSNKKVIIIGGIVLLVGLILITILTSNKNNYYLTLIGKEDIIIYQNTPFIDEGFKAYDDKGNEYNDKVIVEGNVNTDVVGEYIITYKFNNIVKKRTVSVVYETKHLTYLILSGETILYLKVGETYQEAGYSVLDSTNDDLLDDVVVTGNVNTNKAGTYKITYSVTNDVGFTVTTERTIIVMDNDISVSYDTTNYSNNKITINIGVINNYFDYILLPNGNKDTKRVTSYDVTENGTYKFLVYSKDGTSKEKEITINNIDKTAPSGTCNAKYNNGYYNVNVSAKDNLSGIKSMEYYLNGTLAISTNKTSTSIKANGISNNIYVTTYDNANNKKTITCTVNNSSYEASKPAVSNKSSSYASASKFSSKSSSKYTGTVGNNSGKCSDSGQYMTAYLNGRQLSYDEVITMSVGQTITIRLILPTHCGKINQLTRTTADGQSGWRDYLSGYSNPYVNRYDSGTWVHRTSYDWVITANKKTSVVTLSQTAEFNSDQYSFVKCFYRINVKVQ